MKIGDRVFVRGYIDEIRKDTVIIRNAGGYFGTIPSEVITGELPSAQPERKRGRWKYETMRHLITGEMRTVRICSVCDGGWFRYDMSDGVEEAEPNYCPNCGADMRGKQNGMDC